MGRAPPCKPVAVYASDCSPNTPEIPAWHHSNIHRGLDGLVLYVAQRNGRVPLHLSFLAINCRQNQQLRGPARWVTIRPRAKSKAPRRRPSRQALRYRHRRHHMARRGIMYPPTHEACEEGRRWPPQARLRSPQRRTTTTKPRRLLRSR
jgi:hypothetical protein